MSTQQREQISTILNWTAKVAITAISIFCMRFMSQIDEYGDKLDMHSEKINKIVTDVEVVKTQLQSIEKDVDEIKQHTP